MAGIAGIIHPGKKEEVKKMLDKIAHRGPAGQAITEIEGITIGLAVTKSEQDSLVRLREEHIIRDGIEEDHLVQVQVKNGQVLFRRDRLGVAPLYYGRTEQGVFCFASEVKALLRLTRLVKEFPPGYTYNGNRMLSSTRLEKQKVVNIPVNRIKGKLRKLLESGVRKRLPNGPIGIWLSGGLDSSTIAAIIASQVGKIHTFTVGLSGASDIGFAEVVARYIGSKHHQLVVSLKDLLKILPEVIYHLESFDALLVRSSLTNYLVARLSSEYVPVVFSGEGGDELFAGYEYLKSIPPEDLANELFNITNRLHNTAFQRVDRCAAAHGLLVHVVFADSRVVDYALSIPVKFKIKKGVEKWILRQAVADLLPSGVLKRTKVKFWEGAGVGILLSQYADKKISDRAFSQERVLPQRLVLTSKEELMCYRIFRNCFGEIKDFDWMGRTKGIPSQQV